MLRVNEYGCVYTCRYYDAMPMMSNTMRVPGRIARTSHPDKTTRMLYMYLFVCVRVLFGYAFIGVLVCCSARLRRVLAAIAVQASANRRRQYEIGLSRTKKSTSRCSHDRNISLRHLRLEPAHACPFAFSY